MRRRAPAARRRPSAAVAALLAGILAAAVGATAASAAPTERFVLTAGANDGGHGRTVLRYAVSDAARFGELMVQMGGVPEANRVLLPDPGRGDLEQALAQLRRRVAAARERASRTEVLLYYSGHADEEGLLLGPERLGYREVRRLLDEVDADVRIAVLDACASGAITRIKGGLRRDAFQLDTSSDTRGYAFLTSSSAEETAQESDRIRSSFFTYYLLSGMRGAADASGDGKVTLNEAYHFAFEETLARTVELQGGAQHPTYDMSLTGTRDVVMTDVRQTSAGLVLGEDIGGRLFVRNASRQVVAELFKSGDRTVELGLEPGAYEVYLERHRDLHLAGVEVAEGEHRPLRAADFAPADREYAVARGGAPWLDAAAPWAATRSGRWRLEVHLGTVGPEPRARSRTYDPPPRETEDMLSGGFVTGRPGPWDALSGLSLGFWLRDDLEVRLSYSSLSSDVPGVNWADFAGNYVVLEEVRLYSLLVGARQYLPMPAAWRRARPYAAAAFGSYVGSEKGSTVGDVDESWSEQRGALGGQVGVGMDVRLTGRVALGLELAYNHMGEFRRPIGGRTRYNGGEFRAGVSWIFGRGR